MARITIGTTNYDSYASVATADKYLAADYSASDWRDADDDTKGRALVTATRLLDRLTWAGSKTDSDQLQAWPRTGTGDSTIDEDIVPQRVIDASIILANDILTGSDVEGANSTEQKIKSQKAGSVSIEYFRDDADGTRLPQRAMELLVGLLGGSGVSAGALSYGTDTCSTLEYSYQPSRP